MAHEELALLRRLQRHMGVIRHSHNAFVFVEVTIERILGGACNLNYLFAHLFVIMCFQILSKTRHAEYKNAKKVLKIHRRDS